MLVALWIGSGVDAAVLSASATVSVSTEAASSADAVGADGIVGIVGSVAGACDAALSGPPLPGPPLPLSASFAVTFVSAVTTGD